MNDYNNTKTENDAKLFKQLEIVNTLIKNGLMADAETALYQYNFDDLSVGLQLYYRYLQSRIYLADFMLNGNISDLYSADECSTDIIELSKGAGCKLKNYNYLVVRCLCKMQIALNETGGAKEIAHAHALYLMGVGETKYPEKGIYAWMKNELINPPH